MAGIGVEAGGGVGRASVGVVGARGAGVWDDWPVEGT